LRHTGRMGVSSISNPTFLVMSQLILGFLILLSFKIQIVVISSDDAGTTFADNF